MSKRFMKRIGSIGLATLVLAGSLQAADAAGCTIYQHRDYGGAHYYLGNGDDMKMIRAPDYGTSDGIHRFIYDSSWNDQVSSFRVDNGCVLTLWEHVDYNGARFRSSKSYTYVGSGWNDKASEAVCECKGLSNF